MDRAEILRRLDEMADEVKETDPAATAGLRMLAAGMADEERAYFVLLSAMRSVTGARAWELAYAMKTSQLMRQGAPAEKPA